MAHIGSIYAEQLRREHERERARVVPFATRAAALNARAHLDRSHLHAVIVAREEAEQAPYGEPVQVLLPRVDAWADRHPTAARNVSTVVWLAAGAGLVYALVAAL